MDRGGSYHCIGGGDKNHAQKKKFKKANGCLRRSYEKLWKEEKKKAKEKRKDTSI